MDLASAIRDLPDEALVPVGWVRERLDGSSDVRLVDLTVSDAAEELGRAPSTIRTWCGEGRLRGAYRLRGREWRIPPSALRDLGRQAVEKREGEGEPVDLGAWRSVGGER